MSKPSKILLDNPILINLYDQKIKKIHEQKQLSDQMKVTLKTLNESSRLTRKNLVSAITVSSQAGYFDYYQPPEDVKKAENDKVLNQLAKRIQSAHLEIERINNEISAMEIASADMNKKNVLQEPRDLNQWYALNSFDKPVIDFNITTSSSRSRSSTGDTLTSFEASRKIFGGTKHHRSFKSSATIMKLGRLTR